jgi:hypothetical protein
MFSLLRFIGRDPEAWVEHASAYADLAGEELGTLSRSWSRRAACYVIAGVAALVAAMLAGTSVMLWSLQASGAPPWPLFAVPALPALIAVGAAWFASSSVTASPLTELRNQWRKDVSLLRTAMHEARTS